MADMVYKQPLGQVMSISNELVTIYEVPAGLKAQVSRLFICNQDEDIVEVSITVARKGAADAPKQYIYYHLQCPVGDTFLSAIDLGMESTDEIRVIGHNSSLISAQVYGAEFDYRGERVF